jgi:hypothetical protein
MRLVAGEDQEVRLALQGIDLGRPTQASVDFQASASWS